MVNLLFLHVSVNNFRCLITSSVWTVDQMITFILLFALLYLHVGEVLTLSGDSLYIYTQTVLLFSGISCF
jgi:hypothetical protein